MQFSLIIPTLNEEKYIGLLLESIANQDYSDYEVIVVNGLSTDKTADIVKSYHKKISNLNLFTSTKNNVSLQRNIGGINSKANYLLFIDSDVILPTNFLSSLQKKLINNPQKDIFCCYFKPISNRKVDLVIHFLYFLVIKFSLFVKPGFPGSFIGIKRRLFLENQGFNDKIIFGEDQEFTERVVKKGARAILFNRPSLFVSVRRFDLQGRKTVIMIFFKYIKTVLNNKYITKPLFNYPVGAYNKRDAEISSTIK